MFYGVLFLAGISFAAVHHYQTPPALASTPLPGMLPARMLP
jgi:hypothetical protein